MTDDARQLICDLHKRDGATPIGKLPGVWHRVLDSSWQIWVNGHMQPMKGGPTNDIEIHPGDCYVEYNGWPAGSFSVIHGTGIIAAGECANYETFCEALRNAEPLEVA